MDLILVILILVFVFIVLVWSILHSIKADREKRAREFDEKLRRRFTERKPSICIEVDGCKIMLKEDFVKREWNKTGEGGIPIRGQYESATHFLKRVDEYRKMKAEQKRRYDELTRKQQSILDKNKRTPLPKSEYEADEIKKNYNGEK